MNGHDVMHSIPQTIADAIAGHAARAPRRPAIVCAGLPAFSYRELDETIRRIGRDLHSAGIGASSRVGIVLPNGPEALVVTIAVSAHTIGFPLNPALGTSEFEFELARADLDALVLPDWIDSPAAVAARARAIGTFYTSRATRSLAEIRLRPGIEVSASHRRSGLPSSGSVSVIQTSSGSTGIPKLILVTHANLFDIAGKMRNWFGLSTNDRCACTLPISSGFGFKVAMVAPLLLGSSVALVKTQRPENIAEWISELHPTWFLATPTLLHAALDALRSTAREKIEHSLRFFASTSAYLPEAVRAGLETILGVPALEFYGLREAGIVAANPAPPALRKPGSAGLISANVAILSPDGEILPRCQVGAIAVRGQGVSPGYIDALPRGHDTVPDTHTSRDEWKLTGDSGIIDEDGFLSIVGRVKEIINRGGEKISPYEIEKTLLTHPAVREAAAFAVPHPRLGENVSAAVVLLPDAKADAMELRDHLLARLATSKLPQRIEIISSIPKNHAGKVQRAELANDAINRRRRISPPETPLEFQILQIWQRLLQSTTIGVEDDFFEAGGDSLLGEHMLLEVEKAVGYRFPDAFLHRVSTIRQLASIAARNCNADNELVTKVRDGTLDPFFFCHGTFNTRGLYSLKLAEQIKAEIPLYLLHPIQEFDTAVDSSVQDIASKYVPHLLALQSNGRFRLGGYCRNGLLAWEIAHQLMRFGREVESIVLIDVISLNSRTPFRLIRWLTRLATSLSVPKPFDARLRRRSMQRVWNKARQAEGDQPDTAVIGALLFYPHLLFLATRWMMRFARRKLSAKPRICRGDMATRSSFSHQLGNVELDYRLMADYVPPTLNCDVVAIVCEQNSKTFSYSPAAWCKRARTVRNFTVPGDHQTCITVHFSELGELIERSFDHPLAAPLTNKKGGV